ncbi:unnamed protein product [Adineta steineri]|uniref:YrhK domain-containing protein n=1 Tax=Adineta steineri TaxID=433720 RepID=A0A819SFN5_9BILA|nr:unnamed protein product [Adineta steineri]CAF4058676.1 unnamed protein product [Adineta steineri]
MENSLSYHQSVIIPTIKIETNHSTIITEINVLNRPKSLIWRLFHGTNYLFGCLGFIGASTMYLDQLQEESSKAIAAGGWLYTLGSLLFLFADLQEWWYYRIGCCCYGKYRDSYEKANVHLFSQEEK